MELSGGHPLESGDLRAAVFFAVLFEQMRCHGNVIISYGQLIGDCGGMMRY